MVEELRSFGRVGNVGNIWNSGNDRICVASNGEFVRWEEQQKGRKAKWNYLSGPSETIIVHSRVRGKRISGRYSFTFMAYRVYMYKGLG